MLQLDNNIAAVISYAPILPFINVIASVIWLKTEPRNNTFLRFCALQSVAISVVWFLIGVVSWAVGMVPIIGGLVGGPLYWLSTLAYFVVTAYLTFHAFKGQAVSLPVIGPIVESNMDQF